MTEAFYPAIHEPLMEVLIDKDGNGHFFHFPMGADDASAKLSDEMWADYNRLAVDGAQIIDLRPRVSDRYPIGHHPFDLTGREYTVEFP